MAFVIATPDSLLRQYVTRTSITADLTLTFNIDFAYTFDTEADALAFIDNADHALDGMQVMTLMDFGGVRTAGLLPIVTEQLA